MAGRARGICTHGERASEEAGNSRAGNHRFGWFHELTFFLRVVDIWPPPRLRCPGEDDQTSPSPICVRVGRVIAKVQNVHQ